MSKIIGAIGPAGFELVRDRIGAIILDELLNQATLTYEAEFEEMKIWIERATPFDKTELPAINVKLASGDYANKNRGSVDGTYIYNIDFHANSAKVGEDDGDKLASIKVQKLMRFVRAILEDPIYETLDFTRPSVSRVGFTNLQIAQSSPKEDALNSIMSRMNFSVLINERTAPIVPIPVTEYKTHVKLYETEQGFYYGGV